MRRCYYFEKSYPSLDPRVRISGYRAWIATNYAEVFLFEMVLACRKVQVRDYPDDTPFFWVSLYNKDNGEGTVCDAITASEIQELFKTSQGEDGWGMSALLEQTNRYCEVICPQAVMERRAGDILYRVGPRFMIWPRFARHWYVLALFLALLVAYWLHMRFGF